MKVNTGELDKEWLELIIEAKRMGIAKEEIQEFFMKSGVNEIVLKG
ncbi:anti-repressor SinI family protein [Cytobacillus praedii]|nr:anti-repressor SinI family protein [Cytobacillus praedii]